MGMIVDMLLPVCTLSCMSSSSCGAISYGAYKYNPIVFFRWLFQEAIKGLLKAVKDIAKFAKNIGNKIKEIVKGVIRKIANFVKQAIRKVASTGKKVVKDVAGAGKRLSSRLLVRVRRLSRM
jgi:hypothetical protein